MTAAAIGSAQDHVLQGGFALAQGERLEAHGMETSISGSVGSHWMLDGDGATHLTYCVFDGATRVDHQHALYPAVQDSVQRWNATGTVHLTEQPDQAIDPANMTITINSADLARNGSFDIEATLNQEFGAAVGQALGLVDIHHECAVDHVMAQGAVDHYDWSAEIHAALMPSSTEIDQHLLVA